MTSSTLSPALGKPIALGYVQRDFIAPDTVVSVGDVRAVVTALPFAISECRLWAACRPTAGPGPPEAQTRISPASIRINSSSAGGNSRAASSPRGTHRIA